MCSFFYIKMIFRTPQWCNVLPVSWSYTVYTRCMASKYNQQSTHSERCSLSAQWKSPSLLCYSHWLKWMLSFFNLHQPCLLFVMFIKFTMQCVYMCLLQCRLYQYILFWNMTVSFFCPVLRCKIKKWLWLQ